MQKNNLFPHDSVRDVQDSVIKEVGSAITNKKNILMHAPTGLGKTASTLPYALAHALENDMTVFFLTSRHTQHKIAIDTLNEIKKKHNVKFNVSDMIGKKWMCSQGGAETLFSSEFADYCKALREEDKCEFYTNTFTNNKSLTVKSRQVINHMLVLGTCDSGQVTYICRNEKLCPYEVAIKLASKAQVIIADYNYIFNQKIRENFFGKTGNKLENSIIIVDEAHNLPLRVRELMTEKLSTFVLSRAIKEAKKFSYEETLFVLERILEILASLGHALKEEEGIVNKEEFVNMVEKIKDYQEIIADLEFIADDIRTKQKQSYLGSIANFLQSWLGEDKGFARILTKGQKNNLILSYRCLDPALLTKPVFDKAYSAILMSGTLSPTEMYRDVLGLSDCIERSYPNPFPEKNKLSLIIPETTTKFTARNDAQFRRIAEICAEVVNNVPGNCALFFPSYFIRDQVDRFFINLCRKTTLMEIPRLSKEQKLELLNKFREYRKTGAVLMGVSSGSFGEGIDLPGDLLKCVIVVGLPLSRPDLETKQLIQYYDAKFNKGWDYGYIYPAFIKCLQNAGRCIRSETDKGVIIFLDQRFTWQNYYKCFPEDMNVKITKFYKDKVREFFG